MRLPDGWRPSRGFGIPCATQFQGFDVLTYREEKQSQGGVVGGALMLSRAILTTDQLVLTLVLRDVMGFLQVRV